MATLKLQFNESGVLVLLTDDGYTPEEDADWGRIHAIAGLEEFMKDGVVHLRPRRY